MKKLTILLLLFVMAREEAISQNKKLDSLCKVYNNKSQADTNRLKAIHAIAWFYRSNNPDTAIVLAEKELQLAIKAKSKKYQASAYTIMCLSLKNKGNYPKALEYILKALPLFEEIGNKQGIGDCYSSIGTVYYYQSNYPKVLEYYLKALKIYEEIGNKRGTSNCYGNIGAVYKEQTNYPKALDYYSKGLKIYEEIGDKKGTGNCYSNLGGMYTAQKNYPKSLECHLKSLKLYEEIGNKQGIGVCYLNIGAVYQEQANYAKALEYYLKSLQLLEEIGDKNSIGICFTNMGDLYNRLGDYKLAVLYSDSALQLSKEIGDINFERLAYENLATAYSNTGKYKEAYENYVLFKALTDSIFNADNSKQLGDLKTNFEVEKKEAELKIKAEAQEVINKKEKQKQRIVIVFVSCLLLLVGVFAVFMFRRFKITKKQKHIIELQKDEVSRQKHLVEEKQKEMIDSINYAKRIQYGLLASDELLNKYLPKHFVLFNPKDIVSGDFYWATEYKNNFYLAVCDSTGHGVPGAFMSILNIGFLSEAIKEKDILKPNEILNYVRSRLIETISKEGQKDGMDCILIRIENRVRQFESENKEHHQISKSSNFQIDYAAANNEPILLRDGNITELPKDKMPVGKGEKTDDFTLNSIELQKGDSLILYTDGYADQFGGPKGKKFKYKPLNELLLANQQKPCNEQKQILNTTLTNWKGNLEQVDDITIIGIRM
ncbi:MAG: tetratricopeptide repeat protein [Bacteroidia bacterium]